MQLPTVDTVALDEERNVRYNVKAYRRLSERELVQAVRFFLSTQRRQPKKNSAISIYSIIGLRDYLSRPPPGRANSGGRPQS